jgi:thymidylate kinase
LDPVEIRRLNEAFAPPADVLFYLTIPAEWAGRRIEQQRGDQRDLFEKEDYLRRVKAQFDAMEDDQMIRIDATENENAVFAALWAALESRLAEG